MEETVSQIVLQLATGSAGGVAVGMLFRGINITRVVGSMIGAIGGALGCASLEFLGYAGQNPALDLASSTIGGGVLVLVVGSVRKMICRS